MNDKPKPEVVGRTKCPICGLACEVRKNKNQVLYTICQMGHQTKLSSFDSKEARAALSRGETYTNGTISFKPLNERTDENGTIGNRNIEQTTGTSGNGVDGRGNGTVATFTTGTVTEFAARNDGGSWWNL